MNAKQHALGIEIHAEMKSQGLSQVEMIRRTGMAPASWRNWFVTASNPVRFEDVDAVCAILGVPVSEMARRAEVRLAMSQPAASLSEHVTRQLGPEAQAGVAEGMAKVKDKSGKRKRNA